MKRGVTLVELVIAIGILALVIVPLFSLFTTGARITTAAERVRLSGLEAQLRLELLIGRMWEGDLEDGPEPGVPWGFHQLPGTAHPLVFPPATLPPVFYPGPYGGLFINNIDYGTTFGVAEVTDYPFVTRYVIRWQPRDEYDDATEDAPWRGVLLEVEVRVRHISSPDDEASFSAPVTGIINVSSEGGF